MRVFYLTITPFSGLDEPTIAWFKGAVEVSHGGDIVIDNKSFTANALAPTLTINNANVDTSGPS